MDSKSAITIKSYGDGLRIVIDPEAPFKVVLKAVERKFSESRELFGDNSLVLSIVGKKLTDLQEHELVKTIEEHSGLDIICVIGEDEETGKHFTHIVGEFERKLNPREKCRFYHGSVINKSSIDFEENVVILGNVGIGSRVSSKGSILVLGSLLGEVYAGGATNESAFVAALEMSPDVLEIGGVAYRAPDKTRFGLRPKNVPKMAYVSNGMIITEEMTLTSIQRLYAL